MSPLSDKTKVFTESLKGVANAGAELARAGVEYAHDQVSSMTSAWRSAVPIEDRYVFVRDHSENVEVAIWKDGRWVDRHGVPIEFNVWEYADIPR